MLHDNFLIPQTTFSITYLVITINERTTTRYTLYRRYLGETLSDQHPCCRI